MDHPDSNKNRAKNWLYRFLMIKTRRQDRPSSSKIESEVQIRGVSADDNNLYEKNCTRTRNSFRRSLKKMQTRVKTCVLPQRNRSPKYLEDLPEIPSSSKLEQPPPLPARTTHTYSIANSRSTDCVVSDGSPKTVEVRQHRIPTDEILSLSMCYWYWGPMTTAAAEEKLKFKPDGTFLVRDSSSTSYLFSISFRSVGKTMHARIEYSRGKYNLYGTFTEGFSTITELIENAVKVSEDGVYCYSRRGDDCDFPVRLTKPISRYTEVRSLKYLCKFVIRQRTNINDIPKLPLPTVLYGYLLEAPYF